MSESVINATIAGLLHDIGKVLHRGSSGAGGDGRAHSISGWDWMKKFTANQEILAGIRYHHYQDIKNSGLDRASPAYVVYLADNIASGTDRRDIEGGGAKGFDKNRPLESIYNLLNNASGKAVHQADAISAHINYPLDLAGQDQAYYYNQIIQGINEGLLGISFQGEFVNSLLELCEAWLTYVPSSTHLGQVADISLFDHGKITAAIAAAIVLYLQAEGRTDYRQELFHQSQQFYQEKAFCLFSCDISGVQPFIYTISSQGALKGLRARSFYLELMLENLIDEILGVCGLYRTNLIYSGGAHAYILLPNTEEAKGKAASAVEAANDQLLQLFGARLFISHALQECSADELMSNTSDPESYSNLFRSLSTQISQHKLRRYNAGQLRRLNDSQSTDKEGRECKICGISSNLGGQGDDVFCATCAALTDISGMLIKPDAVFAVLKQKNNGPALPVFSAQGEILYFQAFHADEVKRLLQYSPEQVQRVYSKNTFRSGLNLATKLWLGDYARRNPAGEMKTFAELADSSRGISRIGVLRADVDNMGAAFVKGFLREQAEGRERYRYQTLSRTAALSRSLSIFFKYYLNDLLTTGEASRLCAAGERNLVIVYSGGDDLFLVGAWNEVLASALDIRKAFAAYTGRTLSLSAGLAIFEPGYPIARMAAETAVLENVAKEHEHGSGTKNSISLLGMELTQVMEEDTVHMKMQANHTYDWDTFENQVIGEKYRLIDDLFSRDSGYGNSFLYSLVKLLRQDEPGRINIARLAYLLARQAPNDKALDELKKAYANFSACVYQWASEAEDRRQLLTALILYVYNNREKKEEARNAE